MKLFLSGEKFTQPKIINVESDAVIETFVSEYLPYAREEEYVVLLENEDDVRNRKDQVGAHFKEHDHIHCHRCASIELYLIYNGQQKQAKVPPGQTGAKILESVSGLFNISKRDAADLKLEISSDVHIGPNDHIGRFVSFPECRLHVTLTSKHKVQG